MTTLTAEDMNRIEQLLNEVFDEVYARIERESMENKVEL